MAQRITSGPQTGMIELFADTAIAPAQIQDAYETAFSTRPAVTERSVTPAQCPVLDFANMLSGRSARAPIVDPLARATATGFQMEAQIGALAARSLWLALIAPDGAVYDLTGQSHRQPDGGVSLGAGIDLPQPAAGGAGTYMLLAVTSSQPLAAVAAAPTGASAATLLPAVLRELQTDPDAAAATLAPLVLEAAIPAPAGPSPAVPAPALPADAGTPAPAPGAPAGDAG